MKKSRIIIAISLIMIFILVIVKVSKRENILSITTIKRSYGMVTLTEKSEEIVVPLFFTVKDNYYVNIKNICEVMIIDKNEENGLKVELIEIVDVKEEITLVDKLFYCYSFKLKVNSDINYSLKEAYLKIIYLCDEIKINIGSFDFQVVEKFGGDELITISNLKGIINERNKEKDIYGLCIGVKNKTSDNVKIVGIEVLNRNYKTSETEIKEIDYIPDFTDEVSDILGYEYNYFEIKEVDSLSIYIDGNEQKILFIPLKKVGNFSSNLFGIMIEVETDGVKKNIYYDDFLFFTSKEKLSYEDFEVISYENH